MFDLGASLMELDGRQMDLNELRAALERIWLANVQNLTPEVNVDDLFHIARANNWIEEDDNGTLHIHVRRVAA